jgi:hypothetical protein
MAAGGFKEFVAGETLDEDEINDFLMQGVLVFAGTAARGSAITAPVEGQFSFLKDSDTVEFYDSTQWVPLPSGLPSAVVSSTTGSPTVTSGTVINDVTYDIYTFKGDGSIIFSDAGFVDVLCVGGGGVGQLSDAPNATQNSGGGGGGQVGELFMEVTAGTATISVGAGGATRTTAGGAANRGGDTSFGTFFGANGGGGGGFYNGASEPWAVSGGNGSASTVLQRGFGNGSIVGAGNGGVGPGSITAANGGGGGGGAGGNGGNGTGSVGGAGGVGKIVTIIPSALATTLSVGEVDSGNVYFGGGGGGARWNGSSGAGGLGGGTDGGMSTPQSSSAAAANTGGGTGGANNTGSQTAGAGGSGVVIVRVKV